MTRRLLLALTLAVVYVAVVGSFFAGDVVVGLGLGGLIGAIARPAPPARAASRLPSIRAWFRFLAGVARQLVRGSFTVLRVLLGLRSWRSVGFVEVPVGARTRLGVTISGLVLTASPGTVLVDVDEEEGIMLINAIDASRPDAVRRQLDDFYQQRQRQVVP